MRLDGKLQPERSPLELVSDRCVQPVRVLDLAEDVERALPLTEERLDLRVFEVEPSQRADLEDREQRFHRRVAMVLDEPVGRRRVHARERVDQLLTARMELRERSQVVDPSRDRGPDAVRRVRVLRELGGVDLRSRHRVDRQHLLLVAVLHDQVGQRLIDGVGDRSHHAARERHAAANVDSRPGSAASVLA